MATRFARAGLVGRGAVVLGLIAYPAAVYAVVVMLGGALASTGRSGQLALTFLAAGLVAITLEPVRDRLRRRLLRSAPDRLLALTTGRIATADLGERLEQLVRLVAESFGAGSAARITAELGEELTASWQWPPEAGAGTWTDPGSVLRRPIVGDSHLLGELTVRPAAGPIVTPIEQRLLEDAVDHAALVVATARMDQTLEQLVADASARNDELQLSRGRILATMEEERRRVERDIHDGAQQHLVALAVNLRLLRVLLDRDSGRARATAESLQGAVRNSVETLESLSRGLYPSALVEGGPVAAFRLAARSSPVPVVVRAAVDRRWSPAIERAAYFSSVEALQNAIKHADAHQILVTFSEAAGGLTFEVRDDGLGFDPLLVVAGSGTENVRDRLSAVGGRLQVDSRPGAGTTVAGWIPTSATAAAGSSRR
jgi:signal transduction histidine kinase